MLLDLGPVLCQVCRHAVRLPEKCCAQEAQSTFSILPASSLPHVLHQRKQGHSPTPLQFPKCTPILPLSEFTEASLHHQPGASLSAAHPHPPSLVHAVFPGMRLSAPVCEIGCEVCRRWDGTRGHNDNTGMVELGSDIRNSVICTVVRVLSLERCDAMGRVCLDTLHSDGFHPCPFGEFHRLTRRLSRLHTLFLTVYVLLLASRRARGHLPIA